MMHEYNIGMIDRREDKIKTYASPFILLQGFSTSLDAHV